MRVFLSEEDYRTYRRILAHQTRRSGVRIWLYCQMPNHVHLIAEPSSEVACTGTGQDGELQKGAAWPAPCFTDNGDGTVSDNLTGLVWLRDAYCAAVPGWVDALTFGKALWDGSTSVGGGDCNLSDGSKAGDWRLPSVWELMSLLDYEYGSPTVPNTSGDGQWSNDDPFLNVTTTAYYWTSTTSTDQPTHGFAVHFGSGYADPIVKTDGTPTAWVVRDGR